MKEEGVDIEKEGVPHTHAMAGGDKGGMEGNLERLRIRRENE